MHIVHSEASCGWGGQEIRILSEASGMIERGHNVTLLCPDESQIYGAARARGIDVVALPIGRKRIIGVLALRRWIKSTLIDVLNTHSSTDSWLVALACIGLKSPPPIVRTRHISAPLHNNAANRWLYRSATQHIVTTGESLRQAVLDTLGCVNNHVTSIPTGIDTTMYLPADQDNKRRVLGLPQHPVVIGIVATLRSWKGHLFLIEAFSRLRGDVRLVIVGDGPMRDVLEQRIAALNIGDRVIMPGNRNDVPDWLNAFDIFVLPSYANEGVPQALIQAMLCGLACITTNTGAIGEAAVPNETALVVPPKDTTSLTAAMQMLVDDPTARRRLGAAARTYCAARFSREVMLDRMEAVFRNAAASAHHTIRSAYEETTD